MLTTHVHAKVRNLTEDWAVYLPSPCMAFGKSLNYSVTCYRSESETALNNKMRS